MSTTVRFAAVAFLVTATTPAMAQVLIRGDVTANECTRMVDAGAEGGELYALKIANPLNGPDDHTDWLFDLRPKGGGFIGGVDTGGTAYTVPALWRAVQAPSDDMFTILTFPDGSLAIDSGLVNDGGVFGTVNTQIVGNSLPVTVANGIGLVLPGDASQYSVDMGTGTPVSFPYGASGAIEVVFAPIAEVSSDTYPGGCSVGSEKANPQTDFGLIDGYNIYRITGIESVVPVPADFVGGWQYYLPFGDFDQNVVNPGPGLPHPGAGDSNADGDLAGYQNPDALPYTGDEILIFQDSANNPDGTPRISGTGPDLTGVTGYWYAFQPVVHSPVPLSAYDALSFASTGDYFGDHTMDSDGDLFEDAIDLDLDGRPDFISPQAIIGINGLGLTNSDLPLLSPPVFGRANPLTALGQVRLTGHALNGQVELTLETGFELPQIRGYNILRVGPGSVNRLVNTEGLIVAQNGERNTYSLLDTRVPGAGRRGAHGSVQYIVEVVQDGWPTRPIGPFLLDVSAARLAVRQR